MITKEWIYAGQVERVVDGDTLVILVDLGFHVYRNQVFRLARINTPEIVGTERAAGLKVKAEVERLVLKRPVHLQSFKDQTDKYGRFIAEVFYINGAGVQANLSDELLSLGLGKIE